MGSGRRLFGEANAFHPNNRWLPAAVSIGRCPRGLDGAILFFGTSPDRQLLFIFDGVSTVWLSTLTLRWLAGRQTNAVTLWDVTDKHRPFACPAIRNGVLWRSAQLRTRLVSAATIAPCAFGTAGVRLYAVW